MIRFGAILLSLLLSINLASAKVWLLPDYQQKQLFSRRISEEPKERPKNNDDENNEGNDFSCSNYSGLLPLSAITGNMVCSEYFQAPGVTCCKNWICDPSSFPYTSNSCRSEGKIPTGATCTDKDGTVKYQNCECDTSIYPHILSTCDHILSGASCTDSKGTHYQECITACEQAAKENVCISNCDYGCAKKYPDCDECCIECKTCPQRDCVAEGYVATKNPAVVYDETNLCYRSCEDSTPYYKAIGCAGGYTDFDNYWCGADLEAFIAKIKGDLL